MPLPNILEFIGTNITQRKFQQAMEKLLGFTDELDKRQAAIGNGYYKSYATLAAANADIANIPMGVSVKVMSAENGGEYYKATSGAATLTKSNYDPLTQAKEYTDNRTNYSYEYVNGNKIGDKSARYVNLGINAIYALSSSVNYDSVVIPVREGIVLFIMNDKQDFNVPTKNYTFAFYADNPNTNRVQARIESIVTPEIDVLTGISYRKTTVPMGAKYLILNTRYVSDTINWAVHAGSFSSSYIPGEEIVSKIADSLLASEELAIAKSNAFTTENIKEYVIDPLSEFDSSAFLNNYNLTRAEAIAAVPVKLRKQNLTITYNEVEKLTFINDKISNWNIQRLWLRPTNTIAEGKINHVDDRMLYEGFTIGGSGVLSSEHPLNRSAIIPIHRTYTDGVENKLSVVSQLQPFTNLGFGFLNAVGETISGTYVGGFVNVVSRTIPADAKYIGITLEAYNTSTQVTNGAGNWDIAKKYLTYFPDNSKPIVTNLKNHDGFENFKYGEHQSLIIDKTPTGDQLISPYFKETAKASNGLHIAHFVKKVEFQKGKQDLRKPDGSYRRFSITRIGKQASTGGVYIQVTFENEKGVMVSPDLGTNIIVQPNEDGLVDIEWVSTRIADYFKLRVTIDSTYIPNGNIDFLFENGEIHPKVITKSEKIKGVNNGVQFTQFQQVGVAKTVSNQSQPDPKPVAVTMSMLNGVVSQNVVGSKGEEYQQMAMIASKTAGFAGKANIYVDSKSNYPNNPKISLLRAPSSVDYNLAIAPIAQQNTDVMGKTLSSQYIHPDICYCSQPVGGYKYWMINSVWPNANEQFEDPEVFVSNDGIEWMRVRGFTELESGGIAFKLPEVYWNSNHKTGFMPIPISGSFEFAKETVTEVSDVTSTYLAHDPAISYHNGYVNMYVLYNFGLGSSTRDHKYIICLRTNNGKDWEIVREDGSTMPYNEANSKLLFTKTNGIRNHIKYYYGSGGAGSSRAYAPQIVKVSDSEWYMYVRTNLNSVPTSGYSLSTVRYRGSNPYVFNWDSPEILSKTNNFGGVLWHFGMHYNNGKFYCVFNGYLATSTDGVNFTVLPQRFFWQGMSSDLYKPTLTVGHDGKVKMAYSLQVHTSIPHPYKPQVPYNSVNPERLYHYVKLPVTLVTEFSSLADMEVRATTAVEDAYVDVIIASISQATKSVKFNLVPCARSLIEVTNALDVTYDDEIYVVAHLNARNGGSLEFKGVAATLPNSVLN
ncbi:hypothetical protein [Acinetobacter schindleri]|uniref:hypothetical protein n=1 Tax=Acinetobacter schindleri TaxID=108981 RepID=UPI0013B08126|nr:hypothetical protein [Acinetobacter schindleri]QIC64450.1 hypothetical protein FSC11_08755 [Acinetobacter schindleri]